MKNTGIGFVGLGQMGLGMAANLASDPQPFYVFDKSPAAMDKLIDQLGSDKPAIAADSIGVLAANCEVIFLCLPGADEVHELLFGSSNNADGLVGSAPPGLCIIDMSTIDRSAAVSFHDKLAGAGITYVDCPISGLPFRAIDGTLTLMFGGDRVHFDRVKPQLDRMGSSVIHCGDIGAGQMMKAVNNIIYDINIVALCEILPLAVAAGLSVEALERVVTTGSSRSFAGDHFVPRMVTRQFDNDFAMQDAYKDILNVQKMAVEQKALTPLMNAMISSYQSAIAAGLGREPKSAIIKIYENVLGRKFIRD